MSEQRILIVDDEDHLRETMQLALEAVGYEVETAADGFRALERFETGTGWDLVLLDQRMPAMDGLEVLRRLRERDPDARIVMVTAYGTIELAVDAMRAGAVDFLRKPFTPDVLRGAVKAALAQPRRRAATGDHSLTRLMPVSPDRGEPLIHFRTLNGYKFWPVPLPQGGEETEALRIRRAYEIQAPSAETMRCAVDLTTGVRELVRDRIERDLPPDHEIWDTVCKSALSQHLWEKAELPSDNLLVYGLTREQLETVRMLAGLGPGARR